MEKRKSTASVQRDGADRSVVAPIIPQQNQKINRRIEKMRENYGLTDEQVEDEIVRLTASEEVALARFEQRLRYRRRQVLYNLRDLEKKGKALMEAGLTREILESMYKEGDE